MTSYLDNLTDDPVRWAWAGVWAAGFIAVCLWAAFKGRRKSEVTSEYLVLYASQTGQAEEIARDNAASLATGGRDAQAISTDKVTVAQLRAAKHILCVISTTGEGDAPDEALRFEKTLMREAYNLAGRSVAVLALGDSKYDQFCAFGHRVFNWLVSCGAEAVAPAIEVDDLDAGALKIWHDLLTNLGGQEKAHSDDGLPWRLEARTRLNPQGTHPLYRLSFTGQTADWQAGDLVEITTPLGHRRDYSIASLPEEGRLDLYVREVRKENGEPGDGSGLLIEGIQVGDNLPLRIKSHKGFHMPEGDGPLLLIGAGSGLAGLRAHILQAQARKVWLIYGERHPEHDGALADEMKIWRDEGRLARLDLAFSRPDDGEGQYVQAIVAANCTDIPAWLGTDGAILCCGGREMGLEVEQALAGALGQAWVDDAKISGRYRRDLY
ncbi:NADPH cytochrome P450 oxidoreductase family protein [Asticcacaulis taihuensis]|uniref:NADPH--hemoprotein reductase n=1 Tax=Asticcacaulis taihuensis TaxID=260084 RepID=A0A1G4RXB5_9CAUL|nr:NADPH cytochrome P450 oxidoreductase family protein [Asticcacaulis taihuensis]SCW61367.1 sulfite reductase (NADPH) flavoprotein alpha-component [Asticcacaulis taihuensis]